MAKHLLFALVLCLSSAVTYASMDCTMEKGNIFKGSCPGLLDSSDLGYCCFTPDNSYHCCNIYNFVIHTVGWLLPVIIIGIVLSLIISCICCICCCCIRRRNVI